MPVARQDGFDPGSQFSKTKRFDHVIINAQPKAVQPVAFLSLGSQHNDRHITDLAHPLADLPAIHLWHHYVEDDQIGTMLMESLQACHPARRGEGMIAC